jgi:hypothetical protein
MRNLLLAVAFALGLGFAATSAGAATVGGNTASAIGTLAKSSTPLVEKTYYRGRYWRHRHWRHRPYYRGWGYARPYRGYGWGHRHYRHRYWRYHHRRYWR